MKLLILTQVIDRNDPILGFFHRWLEEFAKRCERVTVICLKKGEYDLPGNVKVLSLGKERGNSKLGYVLNFYKYIWQLRREYDTVFVHMNQEYVVLGSKPWWFLGKPVYLWRNHAQGNWLTRLSVLLSKKVFYTSPQSYTARFKKSVRMPVGIDTDFFKPDSSVIREPRSILFLGRIAPVKRVFEFVEWLKGQDFIYATIAGEALPRDKKYEQEVRERVEALGLAEKVRWLGAVNQEEARCLYRTHEMYANFTPLGSFDKTIFEAASSEIRIRLENPDLKFLERMDGPELREFVINNHSLVLLMERLKNEIP